METEKIICLKKLTHKFDTLFDYTFQEGSKIKPLNINIIKSKYGIIIDQTDYIMKNIIQEYWEKKTKDEVKLQQLPLPVDTSFENKLFMDTNIIG